ncbi:major histocompatibility complex class I-related gene protein-like isoform X3 [Epinephelus fuscoguttatus]|uniref:major histocompatibility complex class I-related gene protein-like isoform X3 n=1 Tax=Epinephelus fuscoguttatus TaxID=293821 RepID=UPI0020D095D3|nr:major histocompatibility complex class I-related gene protein-like isoform X3 [Epinephelus fuscoguttatus]
MKTLMLLSLLCHFASPVRHSLKYVLSYSHGIRDIPEFVAVTSVDGVQIGYFDSIGQVPQVTTDWMDKLFQNNPHHLAWYTTICLGNQHTFKATIESLMQRFNETGDRKLKGSLPPSGIHIFQRMNGCEWDDETDEVNVNLHYGYDGEDLISLDLETETWIAPKQQAVFTKHEWDRDRYNSIFWKYALRHECIENLKEYVNYGKSSLQRTDLPSVFLLQKSPSSPVSCHATGFYPDRAMMFWRKDGEEIHEDVDHREILPNHDGSFQMSVDLNLSSVPPEDWRRYDCVFHLSGVKDNIITKLDKAVIRTNWVSPSHFPAGAVIGVVVGLLLLTLCITGLCICRSNNHGFRPANRSVRLPSMN